MKENVWNTDLSGKVAVITGGGGVLCSHMACVLSRAGACVAILDRNKERAFEVACKIREEGGVAEDFECDVMSSENCRVVADKVKEKLGECDILINGAGGNSTDATTDKEYFDEDDLIPDSGIKTFFSLNDESVERVMGLNFMGTFIPTQVFAEQMIGRDDCTIINISSMNAIRPLTKIPAYSAAKASVSNFTQWLAVHLSHTGIRVNAIAPGFFSTNQNQTLLWQADGSPTERTRKILNATPMSRFGDCGELDGALLFLADGRASSFITGVVLPVDGGFSAYSGV